MAARKVRPAAEDTPEEAKAPLLDLEAVERRVHKLETIPDQKTIEKTLNVIATREPTSFHQATIYFGLRDDTPPRRKYGFLAISIGIVSLQSFVTTAFAFGTMHRTCSNSSECSRGLYCEEGKGSCAYCGGGTGHREGDCEDQAHDVWKDRVDAMRAQDWTTLALASIVVAFAVFGEIRDAMLCDIALRDIAKRRKVPRLWRASFGALNHMRLFAFLSSIVSSIVGLVLNEGGNVKDICLNTVVVLFLVEIDNLAFNFGLGEVSRMEAEEHGRVSLGTRDLRSIDVIKALCIIMIPLTILVLVASTSFSQGTEFGGKAQTYAPVPMLLIAVVQSLEASRYTFKGACLGLFRALAGWYLFQWFNLLLNEAMPGYGHGSKQASDPLTIGMGGTGGCLLFVAFLAAFEDLDFGGGSACPFRGTRDGR